MIQTEKAKNNGNVIMNRYKALVDASSLDLLSTTLDTVPLQFSFDFLYYLYILL